MSDTNQPLVSQKFNNYNYAPGIATYGIDGKTGSAGLDGNNIYFTDFDIISQPEELEQLSKQIIQQYLPIKGSTVKINRAYKNGDLFFDHNGVIFKLNNIDALINGSEAHQIYTEYFNIAGKIKIDNTSIFDWQGTRLILNNNFTGYDIITGINATDVSNYIDDAAVMNIVSNKVNENSNIEMLKLQSIDNVDIENGKLSIYYNTIENAYYLNSNKPIVINGDVKVNNDNNTNNEYDNFSTVLTSDDTITYFKYICNKLEYNILYDTDTDKYNLIIYSTEENEDDQRKTLEYLINRNDTVFGKIYTDNDEQVLVKLNDISLGLDSSNYINHKSILLNNAIINSSVNFYATTIGEYSQRYECQSNNMDIAIIDSVDNNTCKDIDIIIKDMYVTVEGEQIDLNEYLMNGLFGVGVKTTIDDISINAIYINVDKTVNIEYRETLTSTTNNRYSNDNGIYKYTFNAYDDKIKIFIYPTIKDAVIASDAEITFTINSDEFELNKQYTLYFTIEHSTSKMKIKNILLSEFSNLDNIIDISTNYISVPIPDKVESISRLSLLHNTEIFIPFTE